MLELSGSSGKKYNLKGNERIYEFLKDEKIIGHAKFLDQNYHYLNKIFPDF